MNKTKKREIGKGVILTLCLIVILSGVVNAATFSGGSASFSGGTQIIGSYGTQYYNPSFSNTLSNPSMYWSSFNREDCLERQDFIMQIEPGGCSPAVVRSDLLEEQNVPVFCRVSMIQVNPLIDVSKIKSLHFTGNYPAGVAGVTYYPSRVAVRDEKGLLNSPLMNNVGYAVISLKRIEAEKDMPDWIEGNITATVDYDVKGALGIGRSVFYLPVITDEEWEFNYPDYSFWEGKGYIRAEAVDEGSATLALYKDSSHKVERITLNKGATSNDIYLDGYYCAAGMNIKVEDIGFPSDRVKLRVDDDEVWVRKGDKFLDDKCSVQNIQSRKTGGGSVTIKCSGSSNFDLSLDSGKVKLEVDGTEREFTVNQKIKTETAADGQIWNYYVAYVGKNPETNADFVVVVATRDTEEVFAARGFSDEIQVFMEKRAKQYEVKKQFTDVVDAFTSGILGKISVPPVQKKYEAYEKGIISLIGRKYVGVRLELKFWDQEDLKDTLVLNSEREIVGENSIKFIESSTSKDREYDLGKESESLVKYYYDNAIDNYNDVFDFYPLEKSVEPRDDKIGTFAERALYDAAELSGRVGLYEQQRDFLEKLKEKYPDSGLTSKAMKDLENLMNYQTDNSKAIVIINGIAHYMDLVDFKKPSEEELSATFLINNKQVKLALNDAYYPYADLTDAVKQKYYVKLIELGGDSAKIEYSRESSIKINTLEVEAGINTWDKTLKVNEERVLSESGGIRVKLVEVNANKEVRVVIEPKAFGPRTESTFNFKIGIEKRGIELSTDKTKSLIENLNQSIEQWEKFSDNLGKAVTGLKGACFATSAFLNIKNLIEGSSGTSLARQAVMTSSGGWDERCAELVKKGTYDTLSACFFGEKDKINADVSAYAGKIQEYNDKIISVQEPYTQDTFLGLSQSVDTEKATLDYMKTVFYPYYKGNFEGKSQKVGDDTVEFSKIFGEPNSQGLWLDSDNKPLYSIPQMREIMFNREFTSVSEQDSVLSAITSQKYTSFIEDVYSRQQTKQEQTGFSAGLKNVVSNPAYLDSGQNGVIATEFNSLSTQQLDKLGIDKDSAGFKTQEKVNSVFYNIPSTAIKREKDKDGKVVDGSNTWESINGEKVVMLMQGGTRGTYDIKKVYSLKEVGGEYVIDKDVTSVALDYFGDKNMQRFVEANQGLYKNQYKNPKVEFYDGAPYKDLPHLVPFDRENGWYAATEPILLGFGKPFEDSGRVMNFWVCNVGKNGVEEFKKSGDDICRQYNVGTNADKAFPGLSVSDSNKIYEKAKAALEDAARNRKSGQKTVSILGKLFDVEDIPVMASGSNCQDFMSPEDCYLMFNVCDPVICPPSRCNLGGKYQVSNVVQSGIVGSLALCFPNIKEGIMIPICLTGVKAGIDSYVSILKSARNCLQESLDTGRNVGICDEIKSIYICEFFWREIGPLLNVLIPKMIESAYGQGVRGGGEYLTVTESWKVMEKSTDYFTQSYAVNAMKAFNARATDDVGGEVCRMFVSAKYPSSKDFFDTLLEPDSPVQYTAWFDEIPMTTATVPATSQYKVYYHIYAGKDEGAYYQIYLREPQESGYISPEYLLVDSNYVAKGQEVDEARDMIGPAGYKKLCVNVNAQENCDFQRVTTSFALNYIKDEYIKEQATEEITKQEDCVAGTPSLYPLINPNLQAGAEEAAMPEIYNRGIIRVCSSENPGKQVDFSGEVETEKLSSDRWKEVGYCDTPDIKCWVDTQSISDAITAGNKGLLNETLDAINQSHMKDVLDSVERLTQEDTRSKIGTAKTQIQSFREILKNLKPINKEKINTAFKTSFDVLDEVAKVGFSNPDRAEALYIKGSLNKEIALWLYYNLGVAPAARNPEEQAQVSNYQNTDFRSGKVGEYSWEFFSFSEGSTTYKYGIKLNGKATEYYFENTPSGDRVIVRKNDKRELLKGETGYDNSVASFDMNTGVGKLEDDFKSNFRDKEVYKESGVQVYNFLNNIRVDYNAEKIVIVSNDNIDSSTWASEGGSSSSNTDDSMIVPEEDSGVNSGEETEVKISSLIGSEILESLTTHKKYEIMVIGGSRHSMLLKNLENSSDLPVVRIDNPDEDTLSKYGYKISEEPPEPVEDSEPEQYLV